MQRDARDARDATHMPLWQTHEALHNTVDVIPEFKSDFINMVP